MKFRELCRISTGNKCKTQKTGRRTMKWCLPDMASSLQSGSHYRSNCSFLGWACRHPVVDGGRSYWTMLLYSRLWMASEGGAVITFGCVTHWWTIQALMDSVKPRVILVELHESQDKGIWMRELEGGVVELREEDKIRWEWWCSECAIYTDEFVREPF